MSGKIFVIFYILFIWYGTAQIGWWLRRLSKSALPAVLSGIFCALMGSLPLLGLYLSVGTDIQNRMQRIGNQWLAFFVPMTVIMLILFILRRIRKHKSGNLYEPSRGTCAAVLAISTAFCICGDLYAGINAHTVRETDYTVDVSHGAGEDKHMTIVLVSDLHLGVNSDEEQLQKTVDLINAQDPDLVLCAGDTFNSSYDGVTDPDRQAQILSGIQAKYGKYAVYGNHDVDDKLLCGVSLQSDEPLRPAAMEEFMQKAGFTMLEDDVAAAGGVQIAGRKDAMHTGDGTTGRMSAHKLLQETDESMPVIVLQHEPDEFGELAQYGADLVVAGHTHGGQIFPGKYFSGMVHENVYGYKELYGISTIVTSGAGYYWAPVRVGSISEIAVIDFTW